MNSGAYQIFLKIKKDIKINIGKLGLIEFKKGNYIYTGSALKNLQQRIERHRRKEKVLKWHIDYLIASNEVEIIEIKIFESTEKMECTINQETALKFKSSFPIKKFGSSDCNICKSHLQMLPNSKKS